MTYFYGGEKPEAVGTAMAKDEERELLNPRRERIRGFGNMLRTFIYIRLLGFFKINITIFSTYFFPNYFLDVVVFKNYFSKYCSQP